MGAKWTWRTESWLTTSGRCRSASLTESIQACQEQSESPSNELPAMQ